MNKREKMFYRQITQVQMSSFLPEPRDIGRVATSKHYSVYCLYHCSRLFIVFIKGTCDSQVKKKYEVARRKCLFLSGRVVFSSQKMKAGIFHYVFLFLQEEGPKYVLFISVLTQQSFSKSLPEMDWFFFYLLFHVLS